MERLTPKLRMALLFAATLFTLFLSACGFPAWRDQALREVAERRWHVNPEQVPLGSTPSQTIEFYDAGGKHLGYGKVQGRDGGVLQRGRKPGGLRQGRTIGGRPDPGLALYATHRRTAPATRELLSEAAPPRILNEQFGTAQE